MEHLSKRLRAQLLTVVFRKHIFLQLHVQS